MVYNGAVMSYTNLDGEKIQINLSPSDILGLVEETILRVNQNPTQAGAYSKLKKGLSPSLEKEMDNRMCKATNSFYSCEWFGGTTNA
jgi:hypothetical protein